VHRLLPLLLLLLLLPLLLLLLLLLLLQGELDELEREEFFRLKKVQKNKQKVAAQELARKEAKVRPKLHQFGMQGSAHAA
jgi:K+-transporting ATPase A subunit